MNRSSEIEGKSNKTKETTISQSMGTERTQQGLSQSSLNTVGMVEMRETKMIELSRTGLLTDYDGNTFSTFLRQLKFGFLLQDSAETSPPPGSPLYRFRLSHVPLSSGSRSPNSPSTAVLGITKSSSTLRSFLAMISLVLL